MLECFLVFFVPILSWFLQWVGPWRLSHYNQGPYVGRKAMVLSHWSVKLTVLQNPSHPLLIFLTTAGLLCPQCKSSSLRELCLVGTKFIWHNRWWLVMQSHVLISILHSWLLSSLPSHSLQRQQHWGLTQHGEETPTWQYSILWEVSLLCYQGAHRSPEGETGKGDLHAESPFAFVCRFATSGPFPDGMCHTTA